MRNSAAFVALCVLLTVLETSAMTLEKVMRQLPNGTFIDAVFPPNSTEAITISKWHLVILCSHVLLTIALCSPITSTRRTFSWAMVRFSFAPLQCGQRHRLDAGAHVRRSSSLCCVCSRVPNSRGKFVFVRETLDGDTRKTFCSIETRIRRCQVGSVLCCSQLACLSSLISVSFFAVARAGHGLPRHSIDGQAAP